MNAPKVGCSTASKIDLDTSRGNFALLLDARYELARNYVEEIRTFGEVAYKKNFFWQFVELGETVSVNEQKFQDFFREKGIQNDLYVELRNEVSLGKGSSKKLAQQAAATKLLSILDK